MGKFVWKPAWVEILSEQERSLRYDSFTKETAEELGNKIIELVKINNWGNVAVRIVIDNAIVYSYKMPGTNDENDWWMDQKLAVSRCAGCSSMRAYVEIEAGLWDAFSEERPSRFVLCGGCFPVLMKKAFPPKAFVMVSGLEHYQDHQVIADAMAWQLQKDIPSIC